jgi:hypothetical protein
MRCAFFASEDRYAAPTMTLFELLLEILVHNGCCAPGHVNAALIAVYACSHERDAPGLEAVQFLVGLCVRHRVAGPSRAGRYYAGGRTNRNIIMDGGTAPDSAPHAADGWKWGMSCALHKDLLWWDLASKVLIRSQKGY